MMFNEIREQTKEQSKREPKPVGGGHWSLRHQGPVYAIFATSKDRQAP